MFFRILRSINGWFGIVLIWVYVIAFLMALPLMFVFPLAPLGMLAAGLLSLGVVALASMVLRALQRWAARTAINSGKCPGCSAVWPRLDPSQWPQQCAKCDASFAATGQELTADPHLIPEGR